MENGSINPSEVATLSLLGNGGGYGRRYSSNEFANDSSNAVRINSVKEQACQGRDFISQQISDNADRNRDLQQFGQQAGNTQNILGKIEDQTRFFTAELNLISREQAANAREAAICCCEAKLLAATNQAKTDAGMAEILANQACVSKVADAVANATQNAKLDILLAERNNGHHRGN